MDDRKYVVAVLRYNGDYFHTNYSGRIMWESLRNIGASIKSYKRVSECKLNETIRKASYLVLRLNAGVGNPKKELRKFRC